MYKLLLKKKVNILRKDFKAERVSFCSFLDKWTAGPFSLGWVGLRAWLCGFAHLCRPVQLSILACLRAQSPNSANSDIIISQLSYKNNCFTFKHTSVLFP